MKIAFISTFFTGATLPLMKHFADKGHTTDLYLLCKQGQKGLETLPFDKPVFGNRTSQMKQNNQIYNYLDFKRSKIYLTPYYIVRNRKYLVGFIPYLKNKRIFHQMITKILKEKYDVIYIIANEEHDAIICRSFKKRGYKNVVVAYHEVVANHVEKPELKYAVRQTMNLGYPLLVYSKNTKNSLEKLSGNSNIHVCNFGPFETYHLFDSKVPIIKDKYILFIGSILPYKGLSFFYKTAHDYLLNSEYKFVVAGKGYDASIDQMKKDKNFILINRYLSDSEFANLTQFASCIVCPYVSGSQSGITQTAMVYGTPVVATKIGAFPEFIEEGKNGFLVDYGNKMQLADAIKRVVDGKEFDDTFVPQQLNWDGIALEMETFLKNYQFK